MAPNIEFNTSTLTTNAGTPVANNRFTLRAGPRGELSCCVPTLFAHLAHIAKQHTYWHTPSRRSCSTHGLWCAHHLVSKSHHLVCVPLLISLVLRKGLH